MITVENLTKSFRSTTGAVVALDDITLDVSDGVIAGVVGPKGSGKSTLARVLALRERPDAGTVRLDGLNTATLDQRSLRVARSRIGVVPAGDSLLPQRTAAGNIALPLEQAGIDGPRRRDKVGKLLDLIGLTDKAATYPDQLTAGQRQRIAVARALVGEPAVVLADDPTGDLDATGAAGVLAVLDRARAELGATVLVVTPDTSVVRKIADDVAAASSSRASCSTSCVTRTAMSHRPCCPPSTRPHAVSPTWCSWVSRRSARCCPRPRAGTAPRSRSPAAA
jgi:D-methionine transport system ATP-binding protein